MTLDALFIAIIVAFAGGMAWYRWRYVENDLKGARARLANATKAAWKGRGWIAAAVLLTWGVADMWVNGKGR